MNTTELFAEQVLAGLLVLLIVALVFFEPLSGFYLQHLSSKNNLELIVTGGFVLGAAYLIGMVYDRVADTLLQDLESHCRLQYALGSFKTRECGVDRFRVPEADPFEDGKYRMLVLANPQATEHMEYLRSRIRLTRAFTTAIPGIMVALLLAMDRGRASRWWAVASVALPVTYLVILLLKLSKRRSLFKRPPKTYQLEELREYMTRACMLRKRSKPPRHIVRLLVFDEVWLGLLFLLAVASMLILSTGRYWYSRFWVPVAGLALTLIVGWTWWRISITFFAFLRNYNEHGPVNEAR